MDYDRLISSPSNELLRMQRMLSINDAAEAAHRINDYIENFLSDSLRHSEFALEEMLQDPIMPEDVIDAYLILNSMSQDAFEEDEIPVNELLNDIEWKLSDWEGLLASYDSLIANLEAVQLERDSIETNRNELVAQKKCLENELSLIHISEPTRPTT